MTSPLVAALTSTQGQSGRTHPHPTSYGGVGNYRESGKALSPRKRAWREANGRSVAGPTAAESYVGDEQVTRGRGGAARLGHGGPGALSRTGEPWMDPQARVVCRCEGPIRTGVWPGWWPRPARGPNGARGAGLKGGSSGTQKRGGGRALMTFPERKRGKVPGRDKGGGRGGPGRGSRAPGFVRVSGAAPCPEKDSRCPARPRPSVPRPWAPAPAAVYFPEGAWGTAVRAG